MSGTIVDMPKVTQMLDAGWQVRIWKNRMGSYSAEALHKNPSHIAKINKKLLATIEGPVMRELAEKYTDADRIGTYDFSPEQAITRLAYKVHGEIL